MGNKLFVNRSPSIDQGTNGGSENFEMHHYDIMSTTTSAALRKSVKSIGIIEFFLNDQQNLDTPKKSARRS